MRAWIGLHPTRILLMLIPGFIVAITIHSVFNHFFVTPIIDTLAVLAIKPFLRMSQKDLWKFCMLSA